MFMIPESAMITQARTHKAHLSLTSSGPQIPGVECTSQLIGRQVHSVFFPAPDMRARGSIAYRVIRYRRD